MRGLYLNIYSDYDVVSYGEYSYYDEDGDIRTDSFRHNRIEYGGELIEKLAKRLQSRDISEFNIISSEDGFEINIEDFCPSNGLSSREHYVITLIGEHKNEL